MKYTIFKLGEKYTKPLNVRFLDEDGKHNLVQMGCYGIGVSRLISAVIEQNHDKDGIIWPQAVAPFNVALVPVNIAEKSVWDKTLELHDQLQQAGFEVLVDDRDERAGVKFKDADLLGIPKRVTVGNKWLNEKKLEIRDRRSQKVQEVSAEQLVSTLQEIAHG